MRIGTSDAGWGKIFSNVPGATGLGSPDREAADLPQDCDWNGKRDNKGKPSYQSGTGGCECMGGRLQKQYRCSRSIRHQRDCTPSGIREQTDRHPRQDMP